jgi:uncharacterized protein (DUF1684 family)
VKTKSIFSILTLILVIVIIFYSFRSSGDEAAYREELKNERADRELYMRGADDSPFADSLDAFHGLNYYEPDLRFRIVAQLTEIKDRKPIILQTSDGKEQHYVEYAYAEFDFGGFHNKLLILESMDMGSVKGKLLLAFGDETSGGETYGAGRYLDIAKVPGSQTIMLDFNKAYNPYCAYSAKFSCPFPPPENLLEIAVKAGEKNYH